MHTLADALMITRANFTSLILIAPDNCVFCYQISNSYNFNKSLRKSLISHLLNNFNLPVYTLKGFQFQRKITKKLIRY